MLRARLVDKAGDLEPFRAEWDALAVAEGRPFCAPGWLLPWLRHAAPPDAALRAIVVEDDGRLAGVAPFIAVRGPGGVTTYRLLGAGASHRVEPVAANGRGPEVAALVAEALAKASPAPGVVTFDALPSGSHWPGLVRDAWARRRPWLGVEREEPAPTLNLEGRTYEDVLAGKSAHFRKRVRQASRRIEEQGGRFALAEGIDSAATALSAFVALHEARWRARGGSGVVAGGVATMLADVARELPAPARLQVWTLEAKEGPVAAEVLLAAGGEVASWLGGFDERWAAVQPSIQLLLAAVERACREGDRRLDLGPGAQPFKYRLADGDELLRWSLLVPRGPGYARRLALAAARRARYRTAARLGEREKAVLRRMTRLR